MFIGAFGLYQILGNQLSFDGDDIGYAGLVLLATLGYAISLTTIKFKLAHLPPLIITALSFFIVTFPALGVSIYLKAFSTVAQDEIGWQSLSYLLTLSLIGTALAVFLFNYLVSISSHIFASGVTYLIPVVAVFIGVIIGEDFKLTNLIWVVFIITGVYLMNKKKLKS
jgi:drug/metabolite transporter (DMT)-like permease